MPFNGRLTKEDNAGPSGDIEKLSSQPKLELEDFPENDRGMRSSVCPGLESFAGLFLRSCGY